MLPQCQMAFKKMIMDKKNTQIQQLLDLGEIIYVIIFSCASYQGYKIISHDIELKKSSLFNAYRDVKVHKTIILMFSPFLVQCVNVLMCEE